MATNVCRAVGFASCVVPTAVSAFSSHPARHVSHAPRVYHSARPSAVKRPSTQRVSRVPSTPRVARVHRRHVRHAFHRRHLCHASINATCGTRSIDAMRVTRFIDVMRSRSHNSGHRAEACRLGAWSSWCRNPTMANEGRPGRGERVGNLPAPRMASNHGFHQSVVSKRTVPLAGD